MALLKGFPPAQQIGCTIRIGPGDLEYTLLPQHFTFVNSGPLGFVFDVECRSGPQRLDPDSYEPKYLTTRIVITRKCQIWPVWSPNKEHAELVMYSAKLFTQELKERGEKYEKFYNHCKERKQWNRLYVVPDVIVDISCIID
jgi:hypothetical protein